MGVSVSQKAAKMEPIRHNPDSWRARLDGLRYRVRRRLAPRRKRKKVFITFSDGHLYKGKYLAWAVRRLGLFDEVKAYGPQDLGEAFWARHGPFVAVHSRGFGFWVWKPYIIQRELQALRDDDILVWSDAGALLVPETRARPALEKSFRRLQDMPVGLAAAAVNSSYVWCKEDVFAALGVTDETDKKIYQYESGRILCRKHPPAMRVIDGWAALAWERHYHLFDNSPSRLPNHREFKEHRHDQALLSILMHQYGGEYWRQVHEIFYAIGMTEIILPHLLRGDEPPVWREDPNLGEVEMKKREQTQRFAAAYRQAGCP